MTSTTASKEIDALKVAGKTPAILLSALSMIGHEVINRKGERIGRVRELMLSSTTGMSHYVVVSSGGFMGFRERLHAVPWSAMALDSVNRWFMVDVDAENLRDAPGFSNDHWPEMTNPAWIGQINAWYASKGQQSHPAAQDAPVRRAP